MARPRKDPELSSDASPEAPSDDLLVRVGARIRELRRLQGLTLAALGEFVGFDEAFLSKTESGKINLSLRSIERIARGLGVHVHELFVPRDRSDIRPTSRRRGRPA